MTLQDSKILSTHTLKKSLEALGTVQLSNNHLEAVIQSYCESQRHYHTLQHIAECLDSLSEYASIANHYDEVCIALWMHDLVYNPRAKNNELQSAQKSTALMQEAGISQKSCEQVYQHIMATVTHRNVENKDSCLVMAIDMLILAAKMPRLLEYETQIRQEYSHVPSIIYRYKRKAVLKGFLKQESIFYVPEISRSYEQKARDNIKFLIGKI